MERRHDAWNRLLATFRAIHAGLQHEDLHLPAYGGSLFDPDRFPFLEGRPPGTRWQSAASHPMPLDNKVVLYCLESLQLLKVGTGELREARRVSFRALDVEQIGHVYEGLLDHTVKRALDLVVSLDGAAGQEPELPVSLLEAAWSEGFDRFAAMLKSESGRAPKSIRKALEYEPEEEDQRLLQVCDHDDDHHGRVRPFAGLIRRDPFDNPVVVTPGSVYVTQGSDRRTTGTHYTPRSLTEEIVRHTLDPLVYEGMDRGVDPTPETLKGPEGILELKVCDLAMGSGAFLIQACRYLADKLMEAWDRRAAASPEKVLIRPYGRLGGGEPGEQPLPSEPGERLLHAKRAVAQRCLYGVDKDHRAGCLPAEQFIADLMAYIGEPYYVGLLSAAFYHGAAHQKPMVFQVVVPKARRGLECGRVSVEFIARHDMESTPVVERNTETGMIRIATAEATALELVGYPDKAGGLHNVATVLIELAAETMDPALLAGDAARAPVAWVQRLGFLLSQIGADQLAAKLDSILEKRPVFWVALAPWQSKTGTPRDSRWRVAINAQVEPDL